MRPARRPEAVDVQVDSAMQGQAIEFLLDLDALPYSGVIELVVEVELYQALVCVINVTVAMPVTVRVSVVIVSFVAWLYDS